MTLAGPGDSHYLLDNSVYARSGHPALVDVLRQAATEGRLVACAAFVGEALYSAVDRQNAEAIHDELTVGMSYVDTDERTWRLAHEAQLELARVSARFHRRPPIDFLIAAVAHQHKLAVLRDGRADPGRTRCPRCRR